MRPSNHTQPARVNPGASSASAPEFPSSWPPWATPRCSFRGFIYYYGPSPQTYPPKKRSNTKPSQTLTSSLPVSNPPITPNVLLLTRPGFCDTLHPRRKSEQTSVGIPTLVRVTSPSARPAGCGRRLRGAGALNRSAAAEQSGEVGGDAKAAGGEGLLRTSSAGGA